MLNNYVTTQSAKRVSKIVNIPKEWLDYELKLTLTPIKKVEKNKENININSFLSKIKELRLELPKDCIFRRDEIYE